MKMNNSPIDQIKRKLDLVKVVSEYVSLEKSSNRYVGFCPFHTNVNTPALTIYPEQQSWWCFGCDQGGDVLNFLVKAKDQPLGEIVKELSEDLDIPLRPMTPEEERTQEHKGKLYQLTNDVTELFHNNFLWSSEATSARMYLQHRGITQTTIENFRIGFAPESWDWLYLQLKDKGYTDEDIINAGVVRKRKDMSGCYDYFRNRLIFPIQTNGYISGFGGRILAGNEAKYINSATTMIFKKIKTLYGLPQASAAIRERKSVIVVEGYMDVLALHQMGYTNAVGIMGISLTQSQAKLLSYHVDKVILALDPDIAAEAAISRLNLEKYSGLDIYIASLPGNKDPDELVLENTDLWDEVLRSAKPIPIYMTDYLIRLHSPKDPKERRNVANLVTPLIDIVKNPYEQVAYQEYLAEALGYKKYTPNPRCPHCGKKYHGEANGK